MLLTNNCLLIRCPAFIVRGIFLTVGNDLRVVPIIAQEIHIMKNKKRISRKSLIAEYVAHWYIWLINILFLFTGYMVLPLATSFLASKGIGSFVSGILGMAASGFVATLPLLILNIVLAKRGKLYALAVQFVLFDLAGMVFYLMNYFAIIG